MASFNSLNIYALHMARTSTMGEKLKEEMGRQLVSRGLEPGAVFGLNG